MCLLEQLAKLANKLYQFFLSYTQDAQTRDVRGYYYFF